MHQATRLERSEARTARATIISRVTLATRAAGLAVLPQLKAFAAVEDALGQENHLLVVRPGPSCCFPRTPTATFLLLV
jgi:hypothetical protein